jgi:hypothetical protein
MSGVLGVLPDARLTAVRQRRTDAGAAIYFELRSIVTGDLIDGATGLAARYWPPGATFNNASAFALTPLPVGAGVWLVVVPAVPGASIVQMSTEAPVVQTAEVTVDPADLAPATATNARQIDTTREAAAITAGDVAAALVAQEVARLSQTVEESVLPVATLALLHGIAGTREGQRAEVYADPPAPDPDPGNNGIYRWSVADTAWFFNGPSTRTLDARTRQQQAALDGRINIAPGTDASDVDGVPAQFVLVNLATGRGMPLARVDGRLVQRGTAGFEVILTRAEISDVAQQATHPVSNDLAAEAAARRALISAATADVTVDGVPMQMLLINQKGYGMPLVGADGRLYQRGVGRFEKVPNLADVGAAAEQAAAGISGDIEAEAAARRALISTTAVDISVGGVPAQFVLVNLTTGRGMPLARVDGRLVQYGANGLETVISRAELATMLANITPAKVTPTYGFFASTSLAAPTYEQTWYIVGAYGQSNSMGRNVLTNAEDTIISTTPLYPQHALMLASGTQANGVVQTSLVPLVEASSNGGRETLLSGCVNHIIAALDAAGLTRPHFIAFTAGQSGQPLTNLGRGTQGYNRFLAAVRSARDLARAAGGRPVFLWAPFIQGENETDSSITSAARHAARLERLRRHLEEDVRAITSQREPFGFIVVNTAHTGKATANPTTTLTQHRIWEAFRMLEGHPNFRFAGPMYQFPSSDVIHLSSQGQYDLGHQVGRVQTAEIFGQGWTHVRDTSHRWISATQFEVDFALPRDSDTVLLDKSGAVVSITDIPGFFGLQVVDGTGSPPLITAVDTTNGGYTNRTLRFTLDKAPGGVGGILLCNGMTRNVGVVEQDGPLVGARSCIRTAAGTTSLQGTTNYDWCIPFVRNLGRP